MRLAIFWSAQVYREGDEFVTNGFAHRWFTPLARHFDGVDLVVRGAHAATGSSVIDTAGIEMISLPAVDTAAQLYTVRFPWMALSMARVVWARRRVWDRVLVYEAAPLAQLWYWMCKAAGLPVLLYLGGHHEDAVVLRSQGEGRLRRTFALIWSGWCRRAIPVMVRRAPTIVTGSELARHYRAANRRGLYTVVSSSVTRESLAADIAERRRGPADRVPVVLTVCTLSPVKGVEDLLTAFARLRSEGHALRLRIVGPSRNNYHKQLQALAERLEIRDAVEFTGAITSGSALRNTYDDADVFVLPSLSEGTPKVILEAMSRGLPVVSTDVGAVGDLIEDGRTGLLVSPRCPASIAAALQRLLCDAELRTRIACQGLEYARTMTVEVQTERLARIIAGSPWPATTESKHVRDTQCRPT